MAGFIPEHKIDEVRNAASIVEVISNYVNLKRSGRVFKGLCPFHAEKTPSFSVNQERQIFHCFGCGQGGNVFRFIMLQKGVSFPEAVAELAERYGIDLPRRSEGGPQKPGESKQEIYRAIDLARKFFEDELHGPGGVETRAYLKSRELDESVVREFHLGWAPKGWDNLRLFLGSQGVSERVMESAGLIKARSNGPGAYDRFRGRLICPIFDMSGKPLAFGGRLLEEEENQPKYLNSPETPIYQKGRVLYGFHRVRDRLKEKKSVIIVEGYFDLLALVSHGVGNVVATLGTALTSAHLRLLKGYVDEAVIIFDADEAGRAAAARALPLFMSADLEGRVLSLPEGHDPDTFVKAFGREELEERLTRAQSLLDFFLDQTLARYPKTMAGKSKAAQAAMEAVSQVKDQTRQDILRRALAHRLDISEQALRLSERRQRIDPGDNRGVVDRIAANFEKDLLRLILLHPEAGSLVFSAGLAPHFEGETTGRIFEDMTRQFEQKGEVNLASLTERLLPDQADLVSGLALSEDGLEGEDLFLAVSDYIT
ncbi:MAG: DNA primase, partial [Deltaproteobacteria bacterium]|nr:DNA primase [Deltaproteobacteria bacterium]